MRFIHTSVLKPEMILAKSLYDQKGRLLLHEGAQLKESYIEKIQNLQYNGVYIQDQLSADIQIPDVVSMETRMEAVRVLQETYKRLENDIGDPVNTEERIEKVVDNIVSEILESDEIMINMVDLKMSDDYTFFHSTNVAVIAVIMGIGMGFSKPELYELCLCGLLHDLGKICIPETILNKKDRLTDEEMKLIRTHPQQGYDIVRKKMNISPRTYVSILQHHERIDGCGYPQGRQGDQINLFGRILSIADVYDALTSDRPYRKGWTPSEAVEYIMGNCGTAFDKELVDVFYRKISPYPAGTIVELNDGRRGLVVKNFEGYGLRPVVKVISRGGKPQEAYLLDLRKPENSTVVITKVSRE